MIMKMIQIGLWMRILFAVIGSILFLNGAIFIAFKKIHIGTVIPFLIGLFFCCYAFFYDDIEHFFSYYFH